MNPEQEDEVVMPQDQLISVNTETSYQWGQDFKMSSEKCVEDVWTLDSSRLGLLGSYC